MIVKVQLPLVSSDAARGGMEVALVYDQGRTHITQQRLNAGVLGLMGDDKKAFFDARWQWVQQEWLLLERVGDQSW